jgi:hypothetical protein
VEVLVLAVSHSLCIRLESIPTERRMADGHRCITGRDSISVSITVKTKSVKDNQNFEKVTCFRANERLVTMKV